MKTIPKAENDRASFLRFLTAAEIAYRSIDHQMGMDELNQEKFVAHLRAKLEGTTADALSNVDAMNFDEFKRDVIKSTNLIRRSHVVENIARTAKQSQTETPLGFLLRLENLRKEFIFALQIEDIDPTTAESQVKQFETAVLTFAPKQLNDKYLRNFARNRKFQTFADFKRFLIRERDDDDDFSSENTVASARSLLCTNPSIEDYESPLVESVKELIKTMKCSAIATPASTFLTNEPKPMSELEKKDAEIEKLKAQLASVTTNRFPDTPRQNFAFQNNGNAPRPFNGNQFQRQNNFQRNQNQNFRENYQGPPFQFRGNYQGQFQPQNTNYAQRQSFNGTRAPQDFRQGQNFQGQPKYYHNNTNNNPNPHFQKN